MNAIKIYLYVFCWLYFSCPIFGQEKYDKHEGLVNNGISDDGTIISYFIYNQSFALLNVKDLKNKKDYQLEGVHRQVVISDNFLIAMNYTTRKLFKIDFNNVRVDTIHEVDEYKWMSKHEKIVFRNRNKAIVQVLDKDYKQEFIFRNVIMYDIAQDSERMVVINQEGEMFYISEGKKNKVKNEYKIIGLKKIVWDFNGKNAYVFTSVDNVFSVFKVSEDKCLKVFESNVTNNGDKFTVDTLFSKVKIINHDKIAIGLKLHQDSMLKENVTVWKGKDAGLTSEIEKNKQKPLELGIIDLKKNRLITNLTTNNWQEYKISNDRKSRLYSYVPNELEDFTKQYADININGVIPETLEKEFIVKTEINSVFSSKVSPLLFYFNDENWFYFDNDTLVNFTKGVDDLFYVVNKQGRTASSEKFYLSFFSYNKNYLVFEGSNNIWFFNSKKKKLVNKTQNHELGKHYYIENCNASVTHNIWGWNSEYDISYKDVVLRFTADNHRKQGISIINEKGILTDLINDSLLIKDVKRSENFITYIKEKPNAPPSLYVYDIEKRQETCVYKSNIWDVDAKSQQVKYIAWNNSNLQPRGVVIRYPINYDPTKKYPAIVDIYEKKYRKQYDYVSPTEIVGNGINYRNYTSDGYFVIEPDIYYEIGNPGISALNCVKETVLKLSDLISIDSENIGLIGHSFGSYEVNFILTQTNLFKTAVSSAGVFDLEGFYFNLNWTSMKPDMWRMETQQFRMGKSIFEIPSNYYFNSPKNFIHQVCTPVLLMIGQKDHQVNWNQSVSMFLALQRLNKEVNLVIYPSEEHVIMNLQNKIDASGKIKDWFDYYLKGITTDVWFR